MHLLPNLFSRCTSILRLAVVAVVCVAILVLFWQALPHVEQLTYTQAYAKGNVTNGYMTQADASRLLDAEFRWAFGQLWPLALQAIGVLIVGWLLYIAVRRTDPVDSRK